MRSKSVWAGWTLLSAALLLAAGCREQVAERESNNSTPAAPSSKYLLSTEPEGAEDVIQVRKDAADTDDVVVVGRIGGSEKPWIDKLAAFSIVDPSLKSCSDIPGDQCPTPWDFCCETKLGESMALVKIVDENGSVVAQDARELLGVKELDTVVVRGKAKRDEAGNLTILADSVYVRN
jgi:hypothetical protein